jgi:O-antigen ligase
MTAAVAQPVSMARERWLLTAVRVAVILGLIGAFSNPPLANLALAIALIGFIALPGAGTRLRAVVAQPLGGGTIVLLAMLALSSAWSQAPWRAALDAFWGWRQLLLLLVCLAVFDLRVWKERLAFWFVIAAAVGALLSYASWFGFIPSRDGIFPGVVLRNPVTQALTFTVAVYLGAALLVAVKSLSRAQRVLVAAAALLSLTNLVAVATGRSGIVALLVALAATALMALHGWKRVAALIAIPLAAAAVVAASPVVQKRFMQGFDEVLGYSQQKDVTSMGIRVVIWRTAAEMIRERPLLGYGLGGFEPAYAQRAKANGGGWQSTPTSDPHNQYLFIQAEAGVLGMLAFAWFLISAARQPAKGPWRACALALLAAWCVTSLFSSHFRTFNEGHMIALLLGALLALERDQAASAASTAASTSL